MTLRTHDGVHYLTAEPDGRVVADRTEAGPWEQWTIQDAGGGLVSVQSAHGLYLCAEPDGRVVADRASLGPWEQWTRTLTPDGKMTLESSHDRFLVAEDGGGGVVAANREDAGPWEHFTPGGTSGARPEPPPVRPPPVLPPDSSLRLTVERSNRRYFSAGGYRFDWREISAFSLLSRLLTGEDEYVRAWLHARRAEGFTVSRVILTLDGDYWTQSPYDRSFRCAPDMPHYWAALDHLVSLHAEAGLYLRACFLGALEPFGGVWYPDRRDVYAGPVRDRAEQFVVEAAQRIGGNPNVIGELANEPTQIGMRRAWENGALVELGKRVKRVAPLMLLCGGEDNDAAGVVAPFDFADAHVDRSRGVHGWEWIKRVGEHPTVDQDTMPFVSGEPINMGEPRADGRTGDIEPQPANCFGAAAVGRARRMGGQCFHWDGGLWTTEPTELTMACLTAWHAGLDAFPMLTENMWRGHWSAAQGSYWVRDIYPAADDVDIVDAHVTRGRGPWRVFGCGPYSVAFPQPIEWTWTKNLTAPATRMAFNGAGHYPVAVYRRT